MYFGGKLQARIEYEYLPWTDDNTLYRNYYGADTREKLIKELRNSWELKDKHNIRVKRIILESTNEDITKEVMTHKKNRNNNLGKLKVEKSFKDSIDEEVLTSVSLVSEIKDITKEPKVDFREYFMEN